MSNEKTNNLKEEIKKTVMEKLEKELGENKISENDLEKLEGGFASSSDGDTLPVDDTNNGCTTNWICA